MMEALAADIGHDRRSGKLKIRQEVIKAAFSAFESKGIKQVRMDDLAKELTISKRTLYQLFRDKEELLFEVIKQKDVEMDKYMRSVLGEASNVLEIIFKFYRWNMQHLKNTNIKFFEDLDRYPLIVRYLKSRRESNSVSAEEFYLKGVEQGIFCANIKFGILEQMFEEQMENMLHSDLVKKYSLSEVFETILFVFLRGVCTSKGLKLMEEFRKDMPFMYVNE